jgi:DNA-binding MarR family transcriptional regulator
VENQLPDRVDRALAFWRKERPDLDPTPWAVVYRIHDAEKLLRLSHDKVAASFGITVGGMDLLLRLRSLGPPYRAFPSEIADALLMSPAAVSNRIDRLEHAGLVRREVNLTDKRSYHVILTAEGKDLAERAVDELLSNRYREISVLTEMEQATLADLLRKLLVSLNAASLTVDR